MKRLRRLEQSVSGMNTFSVDEYLSGGIDRCVLTIWDPKGVSVIGNQLFKKGEYVFERYTDPSVIVTAI